MPKINLIRLETRGRMREGKTGSPETPKGRNPETTSPSDNTASWFSPVRDMPCRHHHRWELCTTRRTYMHVQQN